MQCLFNNHIGEIGSRGICDIPARYSVYCFAKASWQPPPLHWARYEPVSSPRARHQLGSRSPAAVARPTSGPFGSRLPQFPKSCRFELAPVRRGQFEAAFEYCRGTKQRLVAHCLSPGKRLPLAIKFDSDHLVQQGSFRGRRRSGKNRYHCGPGNECSTRPADRALRQEPGKVVGPAFY